MRFADAFLMKKKSIFFIFTLLSITLFSQKPLSSNISIKPKFILNGVTDVPTVLIKVKERILKVENGIVKSDRWSYTKVSSSSSQGDFSLELRCHVNQQYDSINYSVEFYKKGFYVKKILCNTYIPLEEYNRRPFEEYFFDVDLSLDKETSKDSVFLGVISWSMEKHTFVLTKELDNTLVKKTTVSPSTPSLTTKDSIKLGYLEDKKGGLANGGAFSIAGNLYANNENTLLKNGKVNLLNSGGKVVQTTTTNSLGSYAFSNLAENQDYTLEVVPPPTIKIVSKILMTTVDGNKIGESSAKGNFKFSLLATDKSTMSQLTIEDGKLLVNFAGKLFSNIETKAPLVNAKVLLKNAANEIIATIITDKNGFFHLENLASNESYRMSLDAKDTSLVKQDIFLADENGAIVKKLKSKGEKTFQYDILAPDQNKLGSLHFDDPWIKVGNSPSKNSGNIVIIENVYYEVGQWAVSSAEKFALSKPIEVMKNNTSIFINVISHTDSKGSSEFNMNLSQKRALAIVDYMASMGINKSRILGKGMGETNLINRCKDGVECSEKEHAQNRRTEFVIKHDLKK